MSEGILQSPRGERETEPTLGPSGMQERLNCWVKNLLRKVSSQWRSVSSSYLPAKALPARKRSFAGE